MAYRIVKTVKGIAYEYEQRSYRVGGKVRTESRYIGPASGPSDRPGGGTGSGRSGPQEGRQAVRTDPTRGEGAPAARASPGAPGDGDSGTVRTVPDKSGAGKDAGLSLQITADLSALKVSAVGVRAEYREHLARLGRMGIAPDRVPPVSIEHGAAVTHQKKPFRQAYRVTVPKGRAGNRQKLRTEYRKALGRAALDAIEREKPEAFARLAVAFDESFRSSQAALNRYILNTDDPGKWRKAFALKAFGYVNQVDRTDPETVGLVDYGQRKDWRGEVSELFAAVQAKGFEQARDDARRELANARRAETLAIRKKTFWLFARRRAIKRAQARIQAHGENLRKLELMRSVGLA